MHKVIYTKTLDNADDAVAESWEYTDKNDAIALFKERVNKLLQEILSNEFYNAKINIHGHTALIRIESTHYCISVVDDMNHKE